MKVDTNLRIFLFIHIFFIICLIMKWTDLCWISFWWKGSTPEWINGESGYRFVVTGSPAAHAVSEPATIALLGIGLVGLAGVAVRRRRKKKAVGKS